MARRIAGFPRTFVIGWLAATITVILTLAVASWHHAALVGLVISTHVASEAAMPAWQFLGFSFIASAAISIFLGDWWVFNQWFAAYQSLGWLGALLRRRYPQLRQAAGSKDPWLVRHGENMPRVLLYILLGIFITITGGTAGIIAGRLLDLNRWKFLFVLLGANTVRNILWARILILFSRHTQIWMGIGFFAFTVAIALLHHKREVEIIFRSTGQTLFARMRPHPSSVVE